MQRAQSTEERLAQTESGGCSEGSIRADFLLWMGKQVKKIGALTKVIEPHYTFVLMGSPEGLFDALGASTRVLGAGTARNGLRKAVQGRR